MKRITTPIIFIAAIVALAAVIDPSLHVNATGLCISTKMVGSTLNLCPAGTGILGVSVQVTGEKQNHAHAIACGTLYPNVFGSTSNPAFSVGGTDQNSDPRNMGDWANGFVKYGCPGGSMMNGFTTDSSSLLINSISCVPITRPTTLSYCSRVTVENGAGGFALPEWDKGYIMANYGQNVIGLSGIAVDRNTRAILYLQFCSF